MGALYRGSAAFILLALTSVPLQAQVLSPALAERFSNAAADLKAGRLDAAEAAFREILRAGGDVPPVHHNLGIVLQQRGRHEEALAAFAAASRGDASYAPARLLAGTSLVVLGRYSAARAQLETAARLMPAEIDAHLQLANVCQRLGDRLCVVSAYRKAVTLAPDDPEHAYRFGSALLNLSEWAYARLAQTHPDSARVQQALGREYLKQEQPELAMTAFQRGIDADPALPDLHLALARIHYEAGRLEDAARELARELAIVPFGKEALELNTLIQRSASAATAHAEPARDASTLGFSGDPAIDVAIRDRRWPEAERLLAEAIARQPQSRDLLVLIARIFVIDKKPLNAAVALKKADAIAPLDRDLRFTLVLAYVQIGRADWARPELERLVNEDPGRALYRYWLGRLAYDAGKYAVAVDFFKEALARDPQFMRAHDNLGLCYEALDEPDKAVEHYRQAVRINRESGVRSPWPPVNFGILLRQRGAPADARALFQEAVEYDEAFAKAHYELGVLLDEQGSTADAVRALERAAILDPAFPEPHYILARIYRRQGDAPRADGALSTFHRLRAAREPGSGKQP